MKVTSENIDIVFPGGDFSEGIHDAVNSVTWKTSKTCLSDEGCKELFMVLDEGTQMTAVSWGLGDSVFRDEVGEWVRSHERDEAWIKIRDNYSKKED